MSERNDLKVEKKQAKKACKRMKRKYVTLWKTLAIVLAVVMVISVAGHALLSTFDNTLAAFVGGTFWNVVDEDPNAQYFTMDFATVEEMAARGDALCQQVEAEGAVLLMNNGALPLPKGSAISCFSTSSVNLVYGGTGSGNIDASKADNLRTALEKAGFAVNGQLWDFYLSGAGSKYLRKGGTGVLPAPAAISEAPWSVYTDEVLDSVVQYGDAAIVVFSRVGGEGSDMEFQESNYLVLDQAELDMLAGIAALKAEGKVEKIIVLINSANTLQVDFLSNPEYAIDACLWIGDVGITGVNAVAEILCGDVNPSGSLADTYLNDNLSSPAMANFVPTTYAGYEKGLIPANASTYMVYQEGIYVGYKYYETRYEDYVMGSGNAGQYAYKADVAFPFGFGLSYTTFAYSDVQGVYNPETDQFEVSVTVTNTGSVPGKETVQVYSQSPYTDYDRENAVEKAAVQLVGFTKTDVLQPGESVTATVYVDKREIASYDYTAAKTYILEDGQYYLTVATDAHDAVNNILAAKGYAPENTSGRMDAAGNAAMVFPWTQEAFDNTTYATSLNGTPITNLFDSANINLYEGRGDNSITWLTRSDWLGTLPTAPVQFTLTETMVADLQDVQYDPADYPAMELPVMGADNGLTLYDMIGLDFDDPKWELLLDQLTFDEMVAGIGDSFHWRMPVKSVEAPGTRDENGPQGLTASLFGDGAVELKATAFTSEDVMAATFNVDLLYEVGNMIGNNCLAADVVCLYGPGSNTHRTPYGGRNFEYYSEDGFLAGVIGAAEIRGIQDKGVDVVIKHFALNDSEQDRIGQAAWINEQAAREVYLKAFQRPFEYGNANGVMTAYTRWGTTWSGGYKPLMTGLMRSEWGSQGMSITDNVLTTYTNGVDGILAGVSTFDAMLPNVVNQLPEYKDDPVIVNAMRNAMHHNLYALANSSGMNGIGENTTIELRELALLKTLSLTAIISAVGFAICLVLWLGGRKKWMKTEEYKTWKSLKKA
ncbi:MAG: glycoside hydrolase family 3 C-terminal domain-containing protein [Clostridia bacterium]|nr:glycoside hydrolase family 3 C-terminal domain-containing protein [Clostridia bacterium]